MATSTQGPKAAQLTPMLRHYLEVKAQHPEALLFYRMGDFFELFFDDAVQAAPLLEVALTARHKGSEKEVPMCGVPHHAVDTYVGKVLKAGKKVAVCDQVEDPREAKGLVKREVTRVITPGTVSSPELLDGKDVNLLAALAWDRKPERGGAAAFLDVSTGDFFVRRYADAEACCEDLGVVRPREVLFEELELPESVSALLRREIACPTPLEGDRWLDRRRSAERLREHFGASTLRGFGLEDGEPATEAAAAALEYARVTQFSELDHAAL